MNRYFIVDDRAVMETLPVKVGTRPSNRWYGASQIYEPVTEPWRVEPGAEVHVLVGGTFLVGYDKEDEYDVHEVLFPGERNPYSGDDPSRTALLRWLEQNATEVDKVDALVVERYRS